MSKGFGAALGDDNSFDFAKALWAFVSVLKGEIPRLSDILRHWVSVAKWVAPKVGRVQTVSHCRGALCSRAAW